jgi:hypothetical protein
MEDARICEMEATLATLNKDPEMIHRNRFRTICVFCKGIIFRMLKKHGDRGKMFI